MGVASSILNNDSLKNNQKYHRIMKLEARYNNPHASDFHHKKRILDYISNECNLNNFEKKECLDIIEKISNFDLLCKNCSNEQIISVICLRTKNKYRKIEIERHKIWKEHDLSFKRYITISDRIGDYFYKHSYIKSF
ncbi:hypothetical protein MBCUT_06700 [Methanobrevibacter cuticularis]|uniref:Uncharacterized protein n=1 Tax=Methanobrevibacter cuticularis TaxID=47311 RepID=A0A166EGN1_9EURY|nr:hypothetical protein [Methanobrevibacter cuticularis]KZX16632.1 hypothetical protein MBCUT_06700 [Methanobrevibacter cuticularis]